MTVPSAVIPTHARIFRRGGRGKPPVRTGRARTGTIYVRLNEAFVYLAVILDGFSRRVISWALADHLRAELALEALEMATTRRDVTAGALAHHSGRGVQYACRGCPSSRRAVIVAQWRDSASTRAAVTRG